ncbi:MAG TPA: GGDEF domain-containing protein [Burkholderiaceae bacterium]|nr:GGDEF domain-containing protein [Burkholderiaceae bacterium]
MTGLYDFLVRINLVSGFQGKAFLLVLAVCALPAAIVWLALLVWPSISPFGLAVVAGLGSVLAMVIGLWAVRSMLRLVLATSNTLQRFVTFGEHIPLPRHYHDEVGLLAREVDSIVADLKRRREQLRADGSFDELTELPNRRSALRKLQNELADRRDHLPGTALVVAIVDMDNFKRINIAHGHNFGDRVIKHVAVALSERLREGDFLARFEGEQFMVIARMVPDRAQAVIERVSRPVPFSELPAPITLSAGFRICAQEDPLEQVLRRCEEMLARAKAAGKNRVAGDAVDPRASLQFSLTAPALPAAHQSAAPKPVAPAAGSSAAQQ